MKQTQTIKMKFYVNKVNSWHYSSTEPGAAIKDLYLMKQAFATKDPPEIITVTVEVEGTWPSFGIPPGHGSD